MAAAHVSSRKPRPRREPVARPSVPPRRHGRAKALSRRRTGAPGRLLGLLAAPAAAVLRGLLIGSVPGRGRDLHIADQTLAPDRGTREFDLRPPPGKEDARRSGARPAGERSQKAGEGPQAKRSRLGTAWHIVRRTFSEWSEDNCFRLAAALSYYTVFSLAPLLLIVIAVVGLVYRREDAQTAILGQMQSLVGERGAEGVKALLEGASKDSSDNVLATIIGIGALILGASGVFTQLKDSLNTIWEVKPRPGMGILRWFTDRLLSFGIVLGIGFLLLVWLIISAGLAATSKFVEGMLPLPPGVLYAINLVGSFLVITLLFAMIYKLLPDVSLAWRHVFIGAAITAALFTLGKFLIGLYLGQAAVSSTFGAAGSILVILLWAYYSALIFLLGAEFTQVYARVTRPDLIVHEESVPLTDRERTQEGIPHGG